MTSARPLAIGALLALAQLVATSGDARSSSASGDSTGATATSRASEISFRRDVAPVLVASCATSSCHGGGSRPPVLMARRGVAEMRAALVGVASEDRPDRAYVAPGAPEESYLVQKIDGLLRDEECTDHDCGSPMPLDNPSLSADSRAAIRAWIAQGARDN